jgi:hypothetical protein
MFYLINSVSDCNKKCWQLKWAHLWNQPVCLVSPPSILTCLPCCQPLALLLRCTLCELICIEQSNSLRYLWVNHISINFIVSCGQYYKNIMIANDASWVISEWRHNLECRLQSSITHLESSIMLLELSIALLENIYSTGVTHDVRHVMIIICL